MANQRLFDNSSIITDSWQLDRRQLINSLSCYRQINSSSIITDSQHVDRQMIILRQLIGSTLLVNRQHIDNYHRAPVSHCWLKSLKVHHQDICNSSIDSLPLIHRILEFSEKHRYFIYGSAYRFMYNGSLIAGRLFFDGLSIAHRLFVNYLSMPRHTFGYNSSTVNS